MHSVRDCTDWSVGGTHRHRCTQRGYASPEVADDLALRVLFKLEEMRQACGYSTQQVVLCGVDNSTTAFAMAVLRLMPAEARYAFCSGRKGDGDEFCGCIDDYDYPNDAIWVVIDDDICTGRACRTVARHRHVHWFGINNFLKDSTDWESDGVPNWLSNVTFHWWGQSSYADGVAEATYQTETGDEVAEWISHCYFPDDEETTDEPLLPDCEAGSML